MVQKAAVVCLLLGLALLAGCGGKGDTPTKPSLKDQPEPTPDTGIILGVVVDVAIAPIPNVDVTARLGETSKSTKTDEHGNFGFEGLPPGDYFLEASKAGFTTVQAQAKVEANKADVPIVKIQLAIDEASRPYYEGPLVYDGFLQCGVRSPYLGVAVCLFAGSAGDDRTQVHYPLDREPLFVQSELTWEATQALGSDLAFRTSWGNCGGAFYCDYGPSGVSPLTIQMNSTLLHAIYTNQTEIYLRVFSDDVDATKPPIEVCIPDTPVRPAGCATGFGLTINQKFTIFTTIFHGYTPPVEWRFLNDPNVPPPT